MDARLLGCSIVHSDFVSFAGELLRFNSSAIFHCLLRLIRRLLDETGEGVFLVVSIKFCSNSWIYLTTSLQMLQQPTAFIGLVLFAGETWHAF